MQIVMALFLGLIWGIAWALCLQTRPGKFLAARYTWMTVVIGIGMDLTIGLLVVPIEYLVPLFGVIAFSAIGIVFRSLFLDHQDNEALRALINGDKDQAAK